MTERYDIEINDLRGALSGCALVVQKTCSLVMGGSARDIKQRNKRVMVLFNGNIGTMQENTKQRKTQIHRY
ncbi:MAG: hypothetical protein IJK45_00810 [Bacteroidaceae bacterium]|nr:hypothetical protein [Bacteroidaceae bacterium]